MDKLPNRFIRERKRIDNINTSREHCSDHTSSGSNLETRKCLGLDNIQINFSKLPDTNYDNNLLNLPKRSYIYIKYQTTGEIIWLCKKGDKKNPEN